VSSNGASKVTVTDKKRILLPYLLFCFATLSTLGVLCFTPLYLIRSVFPPSDKLVSGPLYGGAFFWVPPVAGFFYVLRVWGPLLRGDHRPARSMLHGGLGWLSLVALMCGMTSYTYGLSAYWFATPAGITFRSDPLSRPMFYSWAAVVERQVSCFTSKGNNIAGFLIRFEDGREIDIAETLQSEFAKHFAKIAALTASAPVVEADKRWRRYCPDYIWYFLAENGVFRKSPRARPHRGSSRRARVRRLRRAGAGIVRP
jgi:hypothetical protein